MACDPKCEFKNNVELKVNDNDVELNPFVCAMFANVIKGMVSTLKGVEEPKEIVLKIKQ